MYTLGYSIHEIAQLSYLEARDVVVACLRALQHLHASHPAILHCDVRIANVLFGPEPFLSDLELAHQGHWQVPPHMMLNDWETGSVDSGLPGTLSPARIYDEHSDIYQVGVMLSKHTSLPDAGLALVRVLKSKTMTAEQALAHEFLQ